MKSKLYLLGCLLVLLGLLAPAIAIAQTGGPIDPYESNNDYDHAYGPLQLDHQYAAYLGDPYDKDYYHFDIDKASTIQIDLTNVPTTHPTEYNYLIILYGPDGNIVERDFHGTGDKRLVADNAPAGSYHILVEVGEVGGKRVCYPRQPYLLRVTTAQAAATDSYEENNTYQTAYGPLESGKTYEAYCWSQGDRDCYYIELSANATVKAELQNVCATCDYDLYLVDSSEKILVGSENAVGVDESLTGQCAPGKYYIVVHPRQGYSQQVPYRLTVTYSEQKGPQPGNEAAWARAQLERMGYYLHGDPDLMTFDDGSKAAIALENPQSLDLRLSNDTTWRQATDTWRILDQAFDVDALWVGLVYQGRYIIFHAVSAANWARYAKGELPRENLPVSSGVYDTQEGRWLTEAEGKGFIKKTFG